MAVRNTPQCCAILHNVLQKLAVDEYHQPGTIDSENVETGMFHQGTCRNQRTIVPLVCSAARSSTNKSKNIINQFCHYFNNEDQVPWQRRMAGLE